MLRRLFSVGLAAAVAVAVPRAARADNVDDDDLVKPKRLTVGVADDLLGQLGADEKTLYFVSNRDTTNQLFVEDLADGRAHALFDDGADVTWPRVSPDGKAILYISFRESASGQLCVRRLPEGDQRRCLDGAIAALQAEWITTARVALVARRSVEADLSVMEVSLDGALSARPLIDRNLTSPAVTPDGKWLVYVPVARTVQTVGPAFAAHAAQTLEAVPLASAATAAPAKVTIALPGQSGQPVFARDGRYLYVVQFFTDTNHDGAIDASDHGVLFRVPISFASGAPVTGAPEQLTEESWNCEYPAPAADRLIATCSQDASLDVYALPLGGEVPDGWSRETLENAIDDADTRVQEQLLMSRRLARETTPPARRRAMLALAMVHLQKEEFRAAEYFAGELDALKDDATAGISQPLRILVEQRRAERRREQGRLTEGFRKDAQDRLAHLHAEGAGSPMAEDLVHLARSQVERSLGDVGAARTELEAVTIDETTPAPIVREYYEHADALYRQLDDRDALVAACRQLAKLSSLKPDEQLYYAQAAARAMARGLPHDEADALLARTRASTSAGEGELSFAIDMERAVLAIRDSHPPDAVGANLLALYAGQTRPGRRRALVVAAVQRADDLDADDVLDALVQRDIHDVRRGTHERGEAEDVYERLILARAYERVAAKNFAGARDDFDSVAEQTGSLEAVVGAIDMRTKLGESPGAIEARYEKSRLPAPEARFAVAYVLARQLPTLEGKAHADAAARAIAVLRSSWGELEEERVAQALQGALWHEEYLQTGELATAERANTHYLVALELAGDNPRFRAMILGELGLLHTDVGNYRIALGYLRQRDALPYADNTEALDVLLSKAQALLHVGKDGEAADAGDAALAMIGRNGQLAPYRPLALDWAAVDDLAAGRYAKSLALYDEEVRLLDAEKGPFMDRNRLVAHLSRAAAGIGAREASRALADLDYVDGRLGDAKVAAELKWPHATTENVVRAYRLIAAGLRARADRELGRLDAEAQALRARRDILDDQQGEANRPEIEQDEMLVEAQLAMNAGDRHDTAGATTWLHAALAHADDLRARAHGVTDRAQLDVLRLAAELTLALGPSVAPDVASRVAAAANELASRKDASLRSYAHWLEIYGALVPRGPATAR